MMMNFKPTGKLFNFIMSSKEEQCKIMHDIRKNNEQNENETQIKKITLEIPAIKLSDVDTFYEKSDEENDESIDIDIHNEYPTDEEYYNLINNYDSEFFRLMDREEKLCEGLADDPVTDNDNDNDNDNEN